ncbi:extracellular solute-binding protein [Paenibacillus sp. LHD-38]|uniref:extracellular solute-binding protein n=1 Tax=Paenibacillus sp. LHD-38 TaxID=3072143 RepID=UPI00280FC959|nr:extracellular solute-binding protein [Paenibacillus sp. LHD-38]MDQ8739026.1 extracellular solute-binding protein [Paenibacillus sp. LHD-38]
MKRNNRYKITLLITMLALFLSACTQNAAPNTSQNSSGSAGAEGTKTQAGDDKSPITLTWFVDQQWYSHEWDTQNVLFDKLVTEQTGITINFVSGNAEKLSALIASGDIPDIVTVDKAIPQRKLLERSGLVLPLDELIAKHDPTFELPQSIQDWYRNEDGHFYGLPNYFKAPEKMQEGDFIPTHVTLRARQDIMDQLGIKEEAFNTKEGTLEALRKVRDANIEYNGFKVIPSYFDSYQLIQMFGAKREDAQGNYVDTTREPQALEAYKFLNQLYREGLMPQDSQTLNKNQIEEKVNAGAVFAYTNWVIKWAGLFSNDSNATFAPVGPIKGDSDQPFYLDPSAVSGWTLTMVGKSTKHPERIVKLLKYLSEDEMSLNAWWGPRSEAWEYDGNGKVKFTEQRNQDFAKDFNAAKKKYSGPEWLVTWTPIQRTYPEPQTTHEQLENATEAKFSQYSYYSLPFEGVAVDGGTAEAGIETKINDYRTQMRAAMILAKSEVEVEKLFNEMIAQEEKLGYTRLYEVYNSKFQEAKKKLGIEFAWPTNIK